MQTLHSTDLPQSRLHSMLLLLVVQGRYDAVEFILLIQNGMFA